MLIRMLYESKLEIVPDPLSSLRTLRAPGQRWDFTILLLLGYEALGPKLHVSGSFEFRSALSDAVTPIPSMRVSKTCTTWTC